MSNKNFIKKVNQVVAVIITAIMCITAFSAIIATAEIISKIFVYSDCTIEYTVVNEWEGYQNIEIKLTNTGSEPIYNWALGYNAGGEIINIWNSTIYSNSGTNYVIKNAGYNYEVMPNESVTFGYTLVGNNLTIPSSFENCAKRIKISDEYNVQMIVTDKWDVGFTGYIEITNVSDVPLEAWMLSFDANFTIDNFWNVNIIENDEYSYIASSQIMSNPIQPQASIQIGISANFENNIKPIITNVDMSVVQIRNTINNSDIKTENITNDSDDLVGKMYFKDLSSEDDLIYDLYGNRYFKNQVLFTAYDGVTFETVSDFVDSIDARIVGYIELTNDYQIEFNYDMSIEELFDIISELSANSIAEFVMPNIVFEAVCDSLPNDKEIQPKNSVKIHSNNWHLYAINAIDAWDYYNNPNLSVSTNTVKIGVIDNFFSTETEKDELKFVKLWNNPKTTNEDHGTLVSGIIGATHNEIGVAGICPKTELYGYALNAREDEETENISNIMRLKYALALMIGNNIRVINFSMGLTEQMELGTKSIESFLSKLLNKGYDFIIVCSAGNDGDNPDPKVADAKYNSYFSNIDEGSPVYSRIIVVGAVVHQSEQMSVPPYSVTDKKDENNNLTLECEYKDNSSYGNRVDIVAPGASIYSTSIKRYEYIGDTSAAAPQVAGVAGMIYSINPDLKGSEVKNIIINSAKESANNDPKRKIECNKGQGYEYALLDAKAAVDMALSIYGPFQPTLDKNEAIIFGTVTDENDEPVGHVNIVAKYKGKDAYIVKEATETDDDGTYTFKLPLGTYDIEFYTGDKPALSNWYQGKNYKYHLIKDKLIEFDVDGKIQAYPLDVKLDNLKVKSIGVFESNGENLSEVTVTLTNSSNNETYTAIVNSDNFLYGDFDNGEYSISVSKSGYITNTLQVKAKDGFIYDDCGNLLEKILLTPIEIIVNGTVENYNKNTGKTTPIANHIVEVYSDEQPNLLIATGITDANGEYEIKLDKQGDFIVKFSDNKQVPISVVNGEYSVDMMFENGENIDIVIVLYSSLSYSEHMKSELITTANEIFKEAEKQNISARIHYVTWTGGVYLNTSTGEYFAENLEDATAMINRSVAIDTTKLYPSDYVLTKAISGIKNNVKSNLQESSKTFCFIVDAGCNPTCSSIHYGIQALQEQGFDFSFIYAPGNYNIDNYNAISSNNSCFQIQIKPGRMMFCDFIINHIFYEFNAA